MSDEKKGRVTEKNKLLVEHFVHSGKLVEAGRKAGFQGSDKDVAGNASKALAKPHVAEYMRARIEEQYPNLWTEVIDTVRSIMNNEAEKAEMRLKAADQLGRMLAMYSATEHHRKTLNVTALTKLPGT